jgi:hypothetical protein
MTISPVLEQFWIFVAFAFVGVAAGIAQMRSVRECPCCGSFVSRRYERCPHCRCRVSS